MECAHTPYLKCLARSLKIMQDLTRTNVPKVSLQDLERFLQESFKILQELCKILQELIRMFLFLQDSFNETFKNLDRFLHDISSRGGTL